MVTLLTARSLLVLTQFLDDAKVVVLPSVVNVYGINGQLIKKSVKAANATKNLPAGVYVIGGQKVLVK